MDDLDIPQDVLDYIRSVHKLNGTHKAIDLRNAAIHGAKVMLAMSADKKWTDEDMKAVLCEVSADDLYPLSADEWLENYKKSKHK